MKMAFKHILGLSAGLLALALAACSDDKGNYTYRNLDEAYVAPGSDTVFALNQYEYLDINPELRFTNGNLSENDFTYRWMIYRDQWSNDDSEMQEISTEKNLHYQLTQTPDAAPYAVVLYMTNKDDGTVTQQKYRVTVQAQISSGILALYETEGKADFDYIATPHAVPTLGKNVRIEHAFTAANPGLSLSGNPVLIATARTNRSTMNHVYVATDKEMVQLAGADFSRSGGMEDLFYSQPTVWKPEAILRDGGAVQYATVLINDGDVHCINTGNAPSWVTEFSDAVRPASGVGQVQAAPFIYIPKVMYPVSGLAAVYDNLQKRFVRLYYQASNATTLLTAFPEQVGSGAFDVNHIGKDCIWMGSGYNSYCYGLFQDGEKRELLCADFNMAEGTYGYDENWNYIYTPNPNVDKLAVAKYDMSSLPDISNALFFGCGYYAPVFLYATDRNIYACSLNASPSAVQINDAFPEGETITSMMIYNPNTYVMSALEPAAGTLLYVATWNGTEGKIYEFSIARNTCRMNNTEGDNLKSPFNVFTGLGKVTSMCIKLEGLN